MHRLRNRCITGILALTPLQVFSSTASSPVRQVTASSPDVADKAKAYHVVRYITDTQLHTRWAILANTSRPEAPRHIEEVRGKGMASHIFVQSRFNDSGEEDILSIAVPHAAPAVHAGDGVLVLRSREDNILRIRGVALAEGQVGEVIPVRACFSAVELRGKIRAAGLVELVSFSKVGLEHTR